MQSSNHSLVATASGTFLSIVPNLNSEDILKTVALASIGAIVSFGISILLKILFRKTGK